MANDKTDIAKVAEGLTEAQRKALMAVSCERPKSLTTIYRHAKINWKGIPWRDLAVLHGLVSPATSNWVPKFILNETGLAVRDHLRSRQGEG